MVTLEMLDEKIASLETQREQHMAVAHQAVGAIGLCKFLKEEIAKGAKDHLTIGEFEQLAGGKVESIDPV